MSTLTEAERDQMAHAIGHHSAKGCSVSGGRNHYSTSTDDPVWLGLVDRGLATFHRASKLLCPGQAAFKVTDEGRATVEADPRSRRVGRLFAVRVRGETLASEYWAESHAKARYQCALVISDAWNMTTCEAFAHIESCRLS